MKCTNCGKELTEGAKFCPECGTPVPKNKFCSNCGAKLAPEAKFCPECGTKVGENDTKPETAKTKLEAAELELATKLKESKKKTTESQGFKDFMDAHAGEEEKVDETEIINHVIRMRDTDSLYYKGPITVVLKSINQPLKIKLIQYVKKLLVVTMTEAKNMVENCPSTLFENIDLRSAKEICKVFTDIYKCECEIIDITEGLTPKQMENKMKKILGDDDKYYHWKLLQY